MKFIFLSLLIVVGCSKSAQKPALSEKTDSIIQFEPITITIANGAIPATSLDFASLAHTESAQQDIIISNTGTTSFSLSEADLNTSQLSPFTIVSNTCNVAIPSRKKCKIVLQVSNSAPLAQPQDISSALTIKGSVISLTANFQAAPVVNPAAPIASISVSPTSLNFGALKNAQSLELSVIVKNNGSASETISSPVITDNKITVSSNNCSLLSSRKSCVIKFKYTATAVNSNVTDVEFTKIANNPILHSVLVNNPTAEAPEVSPLVAPLVSSNTYSVIKPAVQNVSIVFKNDGSSTFPSPVSANVTGAGVTVSSLSCTAGLSRGRTCTVNAQINSSLISAGQSPRVLTLRSGTLSSSPFTLNLDILGAGSIVPCSLANAANYGVSLTGVLAVRGNSPNCEVSSCSVSLAPSTNLKSCTDALTFIGKASFNFNYPVLNDIFEIDNKKVFLDIKETVYDDLTGTYISRTDFISQSGFNPGVISLTTNFEVEAGQYLSESNILLNDSTIISAGTSYRTDDPGIPYRQIRKTTIGTTSQTSVLFEETTSDRFRTLMRYKGTNNNDKFLVISTSNDQAPYTLKIRVSDSALTNINTVLFESDDYFAVYDTFAGDLLGGVTIGTPRQVGNKLIFSISRTDTEFNSSYELFAYDGSTLTLLTSKTSFDEELANFSVGPTLGSVDSAANSSKYYDMVYRGRVCTQAGECSILSYVIETDGTVAGTFYRESFESFYNTSDLVPGSEFLHNAHSSYFNLDNRMFGANENGFYYSFLELQTQGSFDYINSLGTNPCDQQDASFDCENLNYLQQVGKYKVKKISNSGVVSVMTEGITRYGYEYGTNPANNLFEFFAVIGTVENEFHILEASNLPRVKWMKTNGASNSLTLVEDLNASLGLSINDVGGGLPTAYNLSPGEFVLQFNQTNLYRKVGLSPTVATLTIDGGYNYKLKGNKLYFENSFVLNGENRTVLSSTDGSSITEEYYYPISQDGYFGFIVFQNDIIVQKLDFNQTKSNDIFILRPSSI